MFYEEWLQKLTQAGKVSAADSIGENLIINKENLGEILEIIELQEVIKVEDGVNMLDFYENGQAQFNLFYKDLVQFIISASQTHTSEEDYNSIVDAYTTPA